MNAQQTRTIEAFKAAIVKHQSLGKPEEHEFKQFEITESDPKYDLGLVYVVAEYGRKNDEGTLASSLCRHYWHVCIGRRGGIELLSFSSNNRSSRPKNVRGVFNCAIFWHKRERAEESAQ